jgi:hypothetical protein
MVYMLFVIKQITLCPEPLKLVTEITMKMDRWKDVMPFSHCPVLSMLSLVCFFARFDAPLGPLRT